MKRRHFYDLISEKTIDVATEYNRLLYLFCNEETVYDGLIGYTLEEYVDQNYFRKLPFRGTYTKSAEVFKSICPDSRAVALDDLFVLCEYLIAVLQNEYIPAGSDACNQADAVCGNISAILDKTNQMLYDMGDKKFIIVEKNKMTTQASEIVDDRAVAIELMEYNHFTVKGDLAEKRSILLALGNYVEPVLKSHKLKNAGYGKLESDAGFLLNSFHIRHNNKHGAKAQDCIVQLHDGELESWYDKTYNTILAVIIICEQIDISSELSDLKTSYTWRT